MAKKGPNKKAGEKGVNFRPTISFTDARKKKFVERLAETGRKCQTAREIGVSYGNVCRHYKKDKEFATAVEEAMDLYRDSIAEEIDRRGRIGWDEPIWYQGVQVGTVRKYDGTLLLAHARRHIPEYRDKLQVDQNVAGTVSLGLDELTTDDRTQLRELLQKKVEEQQSDDGEA